MKFKKVIIHPAIYTIDYPQTHIGSDHGETDTDNRVISVHYSQDDNIHRDTLLHEILHAILSEIYFFKDDDAEENFVRRFTPRLLALLQDNPELIKWFVNEKSKNKKFK